MKGSQKIREYELTGARKSHEYEMTGAQNKKRCVQVDGFTENS